MALESLIPAVAAKIPMEFFFFNFVATRRIQDNIYKRYIDIHSRL
jgi:hypothetical protein